MNTITQDQYLVVKQRSKNILIKINLLNFNLQVVDSIEGNIISGTLTINANSDIRRTCDISMVVKKNTYKIEAGGQIWLDKYIQIYYGIIKNLTEEVIWTNMGIFMINNPNHVYDPTNNVITFQGLDLMAKLTGARNGYFDWLGGTIPQGTEIRSLFIDLLHQAGFDNYNIENLIDSDGQPLTLPYEIETSATSTLYDVFNEIRNNVLPNYEMFFDIDGVFNLKRIYNNASDPIIIDNDIFDKTVMSIVNDIDFENVKNVIEIYGQTLEPSYGNPVCESSNENVYIDGYYYINNYIDNNAIMSNNYIVFGLDSLNSTDEPYLRINNLIPHPITQNGDFVNFLTPINTDYYITVYDESVEFDSQKGVYNIIGKQNAIPNGTTYHQESPLIDGYECETLFTPSNNGFVFCVATSPTTDKPYLKINDSTPHPLIKDGEFFTFLLGEDELKYITVTYIDNVSFDSQIGVYNVVGEQSKVFNCDSTYQALLKAIGYNCEIASLLDMDSLPTNSYIGFGIREINSTNKPYLKINNFEAHPIVKNNQFVSFSPNVDEDTEYYIVIYDNDKVFDSQKGIFNLIGTQQIYAIIKDTNIDSPFYINGTIGEILLPLAGGEYDNIQTYEQARDRAEWELYNHSRMNDKINLTSLIIPWIDVNQKIEYINENAELSGVFVVKSATIDLSIAGTMTLECIRWYDYDPWDDN